MQIFFMLKKILKILKKYGLRFLLSLVLNTLIRKMGLFDKIELTSIKNEVELKSLFNNQVAYGPFKGMKMSDQIWWGKNDSASKYFGEYESHILSKLIHLSDKYNNFIDIGAGDGYYAIGLMVSGKYKSVVCFEKSEVGRKTIKKNSIINKISKNLSIYGQSNSIEILKSIRNLGPSVILCDIEGEEYELFDDKLLSALKRCTIIIELHNNKFSKLNLSKNLIDISKKYFNVELIARSNPNVNNFKELSSWGDNERYLAFSEGRPERMEWICLKPKY